jgi:DNA polymerase-1
MSGDPEKTLLLVDGSSYLYRAFHALPELRSPKTGEPTGAIYGVLNMLRKLATDYKAQARACVFDAKGKTFRDEVYPDYKATRSAMPDDLSRQIEPLHAAVKAIGWPLLCVEGVEADDVIATLAEEAKRRGWRTVISTGDKDLTQLVDERTLWINTMSNEKLDIAGVTAKFGVPPERIVDYLTLVGDAIDNIPGVDGVGPGYAAKWIKQYGSLDNLLLHAEEITGTRGENLRKIVDWLPKARELLTVKRDVPLPFPFEKLSEFEMNPDAQRAQYERFGFKGLLKEVESAPAAAEPAPSPVQSVEKRPTRAIQNEAELRELVRELEGAGIAGFAALGSGDEPMTSTLVGLAFAFSDEAVYVPVAHDYPGVPPQLDALEIFKPWLERADCKKVGENVKRDSHLLANHGIALAGGVHDVQLESYVLEVHERHDLGTLAQRHCGWTVLSYEEIAGKGASRIPFASVSV